MIRLGVMALVVAMATACAPGTPDEDDWRGDAQRAVSDVSSQVETVRLALAEDRRGHVFGRTLRSIVFEAESAAGTSASTFSGKQPPPGEVSRYSRVTDELDRDAGLLADARIAVVAGDEKQYAGLARQLARAGDRLSALEKRLMHGPGGRP